MNRSANMIIKIISTQWNTIKVKMSNVTGKVDYGNVKVIIFDRGSYCILTGVLLRKISYEYKKISHYEVVV